MQHYDFYKKLRQSPPFKINNVWLITSYEDVKTCLDKHETFSSNKFKYLFERSKLELTDNTIITEVKNMLNSWILHSDFTEEIMQIKYQVTSLVYGYKTEELYHLIEEALSKIMANINLQEFDLKNDVIIPLVINIVQFILKIDKELDAKECYFHTYQIAYLLQKTTYTDENITQFHESLTFLNNLAPSTLDDKVKIQYSLVVYAMTFNTSNLVSNTLINMFTHNQDWDLTKIKDIINETLRTESPLQSVMRVATTDTEINGKAIKKDDLLSVIIASANRDERVFGEDSDHFILNRKKEPLISYGVGVHQCLGQKLSQEIAKHLIPKIWKSFKKSELTKVTWDNLQGFRSAKKISINAKIIA